MRIKRVVLSLVGLVGVGMLTVVPVRAHHAFAAEFDVDRPVKVSGTVTKVEWVNPHSWIWLDVKRPDGQTETWSFEAAAPTSLARRGFTKNYLKPGTEVVMEGFMSKGVPRRANARDVFFPDGRRLFFGSSGTGAPRDGRDPGER